MLLWGVLFFATGFYDGLIVLPIVGVFLFLMVMS
jgi:hypothetical protein